MMYGMSTFGMAGWSGGHWLVMLLGVAVLLVPIWRIFSKAGFSGWLSLLMLVPLVNLIVLYVIAFSPWPARRDSAALD